MRMTNIKTDEENIQVINLLSNQFFIVLLCDTELDCRLHFFFLEHLLSSAIECAGRRLQNYGRKGLFSSTQLSTSSKCIRCGEGLVDFRAVMLRSWRIALQPVSSSTAVTHTPQRSNLSLVSFLLLHFHLPFLFTFPLALGTIVVFCSYSLSYTFGFSFISLSYLTIFYLVNHFLYYISPVQIIGVIFISLSGTWLDKCCDTDHGVQSPYFTDKL